MRSSTAPSAHMRPISTERIDADRSTRIKSKCSKEYACSFSSEKRDIKI